MARISHTKFKPITHNFDIDMAGITSDSAKKSGDLTRLVYRWSLDNFHWDNIAGAHSKLSVKLGHY